MDDDFVVLVVKNDSENSDVPIPEHTNDEDIISQILMILNKNESVTDTKEIGSKVKQKHLEEDFSVEVKQEIVSEMVDPHTEDFDVTIVKEESEETHTEISCDSERTDSTEQFHVNVVKQEPSETNSEINTTAMIKKGLEDGTTYSIDELYLSELEVVITSLPRRTVKYSHVNKLRQAFPELVEDDELLVEILAGIMKNVKAPSLPEKYYVMKNRKYKCFLCTKKSDSLPAIGRHYLEKHGTRYLICYACGVQFRSRTNLYKHEKKCSAPDSEIVLKARGIFLGRKGQNRPFLDHTRKFENGHPNKKMVDHLGRPIHKSVFQCDECQAVFASKGMLEAHINKHLGRRPYRCDKCSNAYPGVTGLWRHYATHQKVFICDICARRLKTKGSLIVHMDTHLPAKKFGCPECDKRFAQKLRLNIHINKIHRKLPHPYGCQKCPKRFPLLSKLKEHMQRHHGLHIITKNMFEKNLPKYSEEDLQKVKEAMTLLVTNRVSGPLKK